MQRYETESAEGTERLAAELATTLRPGDVVLLEGELGSGKTTFVRAACRALGVNEPVVSPTFALGRRYEGRVPVSHLDLYRLRSLADEEPGLLEPYLGAEAIAFIEWPEAAAGELGELGEPGVVARVRLEHAGGDRRRIVIDR